MLRNLKTFRPYSRPITVVLANEAEQSILTQTGMIAIYLLPMNAVRQSLCHDLVLQINRAWNVLKATGVIESTEECWTCHIAWQLSHVVRVDITTSMPKVMPKVIGKHEIAMRIGHHGQERMRVIRCVLILRKLRRAKALIYGNETISGLTAQDEYPCIASIRRSKSNASAMTFGI